MKANEATFVAEWLEKFQDRILVEDGAGRKWSVSRAFAVGTKTDDPGLVLKIEGRYDF